MADQPIDFSAEHAWSALSPQLQERILENAWCGQCRDAVRIVKFTVISKPGGIVLDGACATCGNRVCRFVEDPKAATPYP